LPPPYYVDRNLPPSSPTSPAYQGILGDSSYYCFRTADLPLFAPLRTLGVPESVIDVVEPFFRVLVELGYDRSIAPWEPTPARLIPQLDPAKVSTDLVAAIGEGINNALALTGSPPPLSTPAPVTTATAGPVDAPPATETAKENVSPQMTPTETVTETGQGTTPRADNRTATPAPSQPTTRQQSPTPTRPQRGSRPPTPTRPQHAHHRHPSRGSGPVERHCAKWCGPCTRPQIRGRGTPAMLTRQPDRGCRRCGDRGPRRQNRLR
jgi:hypothetical protein